jgi:hypothetical protein
VQPASSQQGGGGLYHLREPGESAVLPRRETSPRGPGIISAPAHTERRRYKIARLVLLCAAIHFGMLSLAIANAFIIFRGPSTPWEIFWDRMVYVLLFPAGLVYEQVHNSTGQLLLMIANSFLWGAAITFVASGVGKLRRTSG